MLVPASESKQATQAANDKMLKTALSNIMVQINSAVTKGDFSINAVIRGTHRDDAMDALVDAGYQVTPSEDPRDIGVVIISWS